MLINITLKFNNQKIMIKNIKNNKIKKHPKIECLFQYKKQNLVDDFN